MNKKYDILKDRSHKEYSNKNSIFKFNRTNKNNEEIYILED
ncbi:hypothetical protein ACP3VA_12175 [Clostridioides difficile]